MQTVTTIGLDIAKSVFQVHGVDATGQVVSSFAAIVAGGVAGYGRVCPQSGQVQCSHRLRENRGRL